MHDSVCNKLPSPVVQYLQLFFGVVTKAYYFCKRSALCHAWAQKKGWGGVPVRLTKPLSAGKMKGNHGIYSKG